MLVEPRRKRIAAAAQADFMLEPDRIRLDRDVEGDPMLFGEPRQADTQGMTGTWYDQGHAVQIPESDRGRIHERRLGLSDQFQRNARKLFVPSGDCPVMLLKQ